MSDMKKPDVFIYDYEDEIFFESRNEYYEYLDEREISSDEQEHIELVDASALLEEKQRVKELVDLLQKFNKKTDAYLKIYDGDKELFTYKIFANELIKKYGDV